MMHILSTLLIIAGLFLCFKVRLYDIFVQPFEKQRKLKRQIKRITGKQKSSTERTIDNAKQMLIASGMETQIKRYKGLSIILSTTGVLIGFAINNLLVSIVLGVGFACIPLVLIYIRTGEYVRILNEKLESSLNTVTNNYLQTGDLILSVEKSVTLIPAPIERVFKEFLVAVYVDSNVIKAIRNMSGKIDNRYFKDWCNVLVQSHHDKSLRIALSGIVKRLSEMRIMQMQADTIMKKHVNEYILIVAIVLGSIPVAAMMMPEWWTMLTCTLAGKITLAVVLGSITACSVWVARLFTPLKQGGGE